jgi:uncharacterized RDD family membrane protein YckC
MTTNKNVNAGTRLASMFLDHFIMTMICMVFSIPTMIGALSGIVTTSHQQESFDGFTGPLLYVSLVGFATYFCKDCINGRSIGKRITKLQIVNNSDGQAASPIKCFIRNIFCILWPIEVIVTLASPSRRLGDFVAGTKVVEYDATLEQQKVDFGKILISLALSYGLMLLIALPLQAIQPKFKQVSYIESSYNDSASKALEKIYTDSLGQ